MSSDIRSLCSGWYSESLQQIRLPWPILLLGLRDTSGSQRSCRIQGHGVRDIALCWRSDASIRMLRWTSSRHVVPHHHNGRRGCAHRRRNAICVPRMIKRIGSAGGDRLRGGPRPILYACGARRRSCPCCARKTASCYMASKTLRIGR